MEEQTKLEWAMNSSDQIQNFPNIIPPLRNVSNRDQFSFLQGTVEERAGGNSWNCYNNSKPIDLNFGSTTDLNVVSYDLKERFEAFGTKRQQGLNNKALVPLHGHEHLIAERKRREKLNQRFIQLSSVIPSLQKMDKASILIDAVKYIKELQEKVENLEAQNPKPIESVVLVKNSCISSEAGDHGCSSSTENKPLPEIEARFSGNNTLISIHCESFKGLLVKVLSELEELNFTVTHINLMPFARSTSFITLKAQIEEGSNITADDVVRKLNSVLRANSCSSPDIINN